MRTGENIMDGVTWTPQEAAACLGRSVKTMAKWRSIGRGPAYLRDALSGRISYEPSVVLAWKRANMQRRTGTVLGDCRRLATTGARQ